MRYNESPPSFVVIVIALLFTWNITHLGTTLPVTPWSFSVLYWTWDCSILHLHFYTTRYFLALLTFRNTYVGEVILWVTDVVLYSNSHIETWNSTYFPTIFTLRCTWNSNSELQFIFPVFQYSVKPRKNELVSCKYRPRLTLSFRILIQPLYRNDQKHPFLFIFFFFSWTASFVRKKKCDNLELYPSHDLHCR